MNQHINIGIIEDEVFIAENLKYLMEDLGYHVVFVANTYEEGQAHLQATDVDLVLLDINLQHASKTGLDLAEQVTQYNIPFIFLTAYSDKATIQQAIKYKPSAYLVKPVNEGTLFAAIQRAIENFSEHRIATPSHEETQDLAHFFTKIGNKIIKVNWLEVYCLTSTKNYVNLITSQARSGYPIRGSLQQVVNQIVPPHIKNNYIQINRATCISKDIIEEIDTKTVYTSKGEFELGASFMSGIKQALNIE